MRLTLCAVGRAKAGPERTLYEHYAQRLTVPLDLHEVEERKPLKGSRRKAREAELLAARIPDGATVVALDATGRNLTSAEFAARLGAWRDAGIGNTAFVIGGADGLDAKFRERADLVMALGTLTWPHMLVRGLLAEQLYRAQCIQSGHPYHRP